jgi:hypothetical protein
MLRMLTVSLEYETETLQYINVYYYYYLKGIYSNKMTPYS